MPLQSAVLEQLRAELQRQFGVTAVPELFLTGGISPGIVLGGINQNTTLFNGSNLVPIAATAPGAAANLYNNVYPAGGCVDFHVQVSTNDTTYRRCAILVRDPSLTTYGAMNFFIGAGSPFIATLAIQLNPGDFLTIQTIDAFTAATLVTGGVADKARACG